MGLVSQTIKNLKGGISQQPDILRFPDQGAEQVNAHSSEIAGLIKRPPTVEESYLGEYRMLGDEPLTHLIHRDESEQYIVMFCSGSHMPRVYVYDIINKKRSEIYCGHARTYLATEHPRRDLRMVTVADYTFIVNKAVTVKEGTKKSGMPYDPDRNAIIRCTGGQYSRIFRVEINGTLVASYKTPDGTGTGHADYIDIKFILNQLAGGINSTSASSGYKATVHDGYLWVQATSPTGKTLDKITVEDGYNGTLLNCITTSAQKTIDLPTSAPNGYMVNITGEAGESSDDFWVYFDEAKKVWRECVAPNIITDIDPATMPHIMVRQADGEFTIKPAEWGERAAGDEDTNPMPSFVGSKISDIFFFRNRLGLLSGENVILSCSAKYFDFFPPSVAVLGDSDPIDVAVSTNRISTLKYAVPLAEDLLLWSNHSQFVLGADGVLSPSSVRLDLTTEFEVDDNARPVGIGQGVYFVSPRASYSSIRRYYAVRDVSSTKDAEDISAHVPMYIRNGVYSMSGSSTENYLTVLTTGDIKKLFVYKFLYIGDELVQQSWSHWEFGSDTEVLCSYTIGSTMYLVTRESHGTFVEKMTFTEDVPDLEGEPFRIYADRKRILKVYPNDYDPDTNTTSINIQANSGAYPKSGVYLLYEAETGRSARLVPPPTGWKRVYIEGDWRGTKLFIGKEYEMRYKFSKFLIKTTDNRGGSGTEASGRLQLRRAWINYEQSGAFNVNVSIAGRQFNYVMSSKPLGSSTWQLSSPAYATGQFRFPVGGNALNVDVTLTSSTPNPVVVIGAGWEAVYVRRSSGI